MGIKLGLGLYPRILTAENLRFARQMGATHIVAHLPDWSRSGMRKGVSPEDPTRRSGATRSCATSGRS